MKVLILGSTGMLGHKLYQVLTKKFDVAGTIKGNYESIDKYSFFHTPDIIPNIDAKNISTVEMAINKNKPDVVINCIGIIKSLKEAQDRLISIWINALFPHQLYQICKKNNIRLVHISTDCVFSGRKGNYKETDPSDAEDIYGKTKYLGEIPEENALTVRTSIIGIEISTTNNLMEWFLSNDGKRVNGFVNAIFSGFPTICFAQIISRIITDEQKLNGLYHISSQPISKFKLLTLIRDRMKLNIDIEEYTYYYCDRSLDSSLYQSKTGFKPSSWEEMIDEFAEDAQQYQQWRTA
jgi:dTDP-4-dehydrorhamnose reductase